MVVIKVVLFFAGEALLGAWWLVLLGQPFAKFAESEPPWTRYFSITTSICLF